MRSFPVLNTHGISSAKTTPTHLSHQDFSRMLNLLSDQKKEFSALIPEDFDFHNPDRLNCKRQNFYLTFDDALTSVRKIAEDRGIVATLFVVTNYVGLQNDWPGQPRWVNRESCLSWQEIRRLSDLGWTIGAHTCSHPSFRNLSGNETQREIVDSVKRIEDETGKACHFFAYPYGHTSREAIQTVNDMELIGFGTHPGWSSVQSPNHLQPRIDLYDIVRLPFGRHWLMREPQNFELKYLKFRQNVGAILKSLRSSA